MKLVQSVHPKVATPVLVGMVLSIVTLAVQQYFPHYAPNAALATAIGTLIYGLCGYAASSGSAPNA